MSLPKLINVCQLIEFLHVDGKDPSPGVQILHEGRVHDTNLDALLNYSNWRSGKVWANFPASAQEAIYEIITQQRYQLPAGHKFLSHIIEANPITFGVTVTTAAKTTDGWIYTDNRTRFYEKASYLHVVGLIHGVRYTHQVANRLMDKCRLTIVPHYNDVTLEFPDDPKSEQMYSRTQVDGVNTWKEIDVAQVQINEEPAGEK